MWVLIVIFTVGTGGYTNGKAIAFQEFTTEERCQSALNVIIEKTDKSNGKFKTSSGEIYRTIPGYCVKK